MLKLVRKLVYFGILPAAVLGPYLIFEGGWGPKLQSAWRSVAGVTDKLDFTASIGEASDVQTAPVLAQVNAATGMPVKPELDGGPVVDLTQVLRFDVSPQWITTRWKRVSTTLAELDMEGLRVPLVTGTANHDLAGSLTYYFDKQHRVQRISFEGYTGNPAPLVQVLQTRYRLQPRPTLTAGLYLSEWNGRPTNALRVTRAPIIRSEQASTQFEVMLELNQAGVYLSRPFLKLLEREMQSQRWGQPVTNRPTQTWVQPR